MKTMPWRRRALALFAAVCMMVTLLPVPARADAEIVGSGQMGDNVYWTLDTDGVLTVSGTGATWDYAGHKYDKGWDSVYSNGKLISPRTVIVENGVTTIGRCLFIDGKIEEIILPDSVTKINGSAFSYGRELVSIDLPARLLSIGDGAFSGCFNLVSIEIPNSVIIVNANIICIYYNNLIAISLAAMRQPRNMADIVSAFIKFAYYKIEATAFVGCRALTHVTIPNQIEVLDEYLFSDCTHLKSVTIPASIKEIIVNANNICVYYNSIAPEDVPSSWAEAEVQAAISAGLVPKSLQNDYTEPVSRGQVARMFVNLIEKSSGKTIDELMLEKGLDYDLNAFSDTTGKSVLAANALGIINGVGGGKFNPDGTLTRAQIAAIINRAARVLGVSTEGFSHGFTDVAGHWVSGELGWPVNAGVINGVGGGRFDPDAELTTEQAIAITYRALQALRK